MINKEFIRQLDYSFQGGYILEGYFSYFIYNYHEFSIKFFYRGHPLTYNETVIATVPDLEEAISEFRKLLSSKVTKKVLLENGFNKFDDKIYCAKIYNEIITFRNNKLTFTYGNSIRINNVKEFFTNYYDYFE